MEVMASYVAIARDLDMVSKSIVGVIDITATGTISTTGAISSQSLTTNTLTISATALNIKSNLVRFRGLDNTIYIEAYLGGVQIYDGAFMYSSLQIQNGLSLGSLTGGTWTENGGIRIDWQHFNEWNHNSSWKHNW